MKAISLWQPWAWAVLCLGKDVENRVWRTNHRGPLILHAAQRRPTKEECISFLDLAEDIVGTHELFIRMALSNHENKAEGIDVLRALPRGGIVGHVEVVDCVRGHESPWAFNGQFQWVVENPVALKFKAYKGERGFFEVDYDSLKDAPPPPPPKGQMELL